MKKETVKPMKKDKKQSVSKKKSLPKEEKVLGKKMRRTSDGYMNK